jgi:DNA-binding winged helix-turn-helix (wHTH) protein
VENRPALHDRARFGEFEVDLRTGELRLGEREFIHLPEQQFRILIMLLERAGEVVTREDMRKLLSPSRLYFAIGAASHLGWRRS